MSPGGVRLVVLVVPRSMEQVTAVVVVDLVIVVVGTVTARCATAGARSGCREMRGAWAVMPAAVGCLLGDIDPVGIGLCIYRLNEHLLGNRGAEHSRGDATVCWWFAGLGKSIPWQLFRRGMIPWYALEGGANSEI